MREVYASNVGCCNTKTLFSLTTKVKNTMQIKKIHLLHPTHPTIKPNTEYGKFEIQIMLQ